MKNNKIWVFTIILLLIILLLIVSFSCGKTKGDKTQSVDDIKPIVPQKIIDDEILFPSISNNKIIGLGDLGRYFYQYNNDNSKKRLGVGEILSPQSIAYSPSRTKSLVVSFYPILNIKLYNLENNKTSNLDNKIMQISWSRNEDKIFYYYKKDESDKQINYSNPDGSSWHTILNNDGDFDSFAISPDENKILLFKSYVGTQTSNSQIYNITDSKLNELDKKIDITKAYWSPDSQKIAFLDRENFLSILGSDNNETKTNIQLGSYTNSWNSLESNDISLMEKVIWKDNDNLVLVIPRDYDTLPEISQDNLYVYNITSKKLSKLKTVDDLPFKAINLITVKDSKTLYFTSDDYLYKVNLP